MMLLTQKIKKAMPMRSEEEDPIVQLKLFHPATSWTWYCYEGWQVVLKADGEYEDKPLSYVLQDGETLEDTIFFAYVKGNFNEHGTVSLNEITSPELRRLPFPKNMPIERDRHFKPVPVSTLH